MCMSVLFPLRHNPSHPPRGVDSIYKSTPQCPQIFKLKLKFSAPQKNQFDIFTSCDIYRLVIKQNTHTAELLPVSDKDKSSSKKSNKALKSIVSSVGELEANPSVLNVIEQCCKDAGVTTELVYGVLREGLTATIPTESVVDGVIESGEKPDYNVRHKYMLTALELLKHLKDKNVVAVTGIFNDPDISADAERILSLRRGINGKG